MKISDFHVSHAQKVVLDMYLFDLLETWHAATTTHLNLLYKMNNAELTNNLTYRAEGKLECGNDDTNKLNRLGED